MDKLPESPVSLNTKVKSPNGFEYQLTMRAGMTEQDFSDLMELITKKEATLLLKKWLPLPYNNGFKGAPKPVEYVEGRVCPTCGNKLVHAQKKDGTKFIKCETNKWDAINKKSIGCTYIDWGNKPQG